MEANSKRWGMMAANWYPRYTWSITVSGDTLELTVSTKDNQAYFSTRLKDTQVVEDRVVDTLQMMCNVMDEWSRG